MLNWLSQNTTKCSLLCMLPTAAIVSIFNPVLGLGIAIGSGIAAAYPEKPKKEENTFIDEKL